MRKHYAIEPWLRFSCVIAVIIGFVSIDFFRAHQSACSGNPADLSTPEPGIGISILIGAVLALVFNLLLITKAPQQAWLRWLMFILLFSSSFIFYAAALFIHAFDTGFCF
jgi:hypothetical protein